MDLYAYGLNNPVMYVDPTGHEVELWQGILAGIGVALILTAAALAIFGTGGVFAFGIGALIGATAVGAIGAGVGATVGYLTGGVDGILGGALAGFGIGAIVGFVVGGIIGNSIYSSQLGTTYNGVGELVKNPKIKWTSSKLPHLGKRMAERNISPKLINETLKRGYAFKQTKDKYLIIGKKAAVIITVAGEVITTWGASDYGPKIIAAISNIFGF